MSRIARWLVASLGATACDAHHVCDEFIAAQCGSTLDFEPINAYSGDFPFVQEREEAVVLINGTCSGTYIDGGGLGRVILTAGHCVGESDSVLVVFNHEECADGTNGAWEGLVIERADQPDFALIALVGEPDVTPSRLGARATTDLAIIQHALGRPKVIAEGTLLDARNGLIRYADLDTLAGGSGAGVLNREGLVVGVHSDGDCRGEASANWGWSSESIVEASLLDSSSLYD